MRKLQRGFVHRLMVLLLAVVVIGFVGYTAYKNGQLKLVSPENLEPSPTSEAEQNVSWEEYRNEEAGYSFRYPSDYKLLVNKTLSVDGVEVESNNTTTLVSPYPNGNENTFNLTISHFPKSAVFQNIVQCVGISKEDGRAYDFANVNALIFENTPCGPFGSTIIYFEGNELNYKIELVTQAESADVMHNAEQILSTFRFHN
jgi:hypothetical protein